MMTSPLFVIVASAAVGLAILIGLTILVNRWDARLRQRKAALSFTRWPPDARKLPNGQLEVVEFGSARWDQIPQLLLWGFFIVAILLSFPIPGQSNMFVVGKMIFIATFLLIAIISAVWLRSRHTYYKIDTNAGQAIKETRVFGRAGKAENYLLKLPVQASTDCQYKDPDRRESFLQYATCWELKNGRKLRIVHKSQEEADRFRDALVKHGYPVMGHPPA